MRKNWNFGVERADEKNGTLRGFCGAIKGQQIA
jgi:hypothetical protein